MISGQKLVNEFGKCNTEKHHWSKVQVPSICLLWKVSTWKLRNSREVPLWHPLMSDNFVLHRNEWCVGISKMGIHNRLFFLFVNFSCTMTSFTQSEIGSRLDHHMHDDLRRWPSARYSLAARSKIITVAWRGLLVKIWQCTRFLVVHTTVSRTSSRKGQYNLIPCARYK